MRTLRCLFLIAVMAPSAALAAKPPMLSWGKPGVSLAAYREDAVSCGRQGHYLDISNTEAAKVFKQASSQLENNENNLASSAMTGDTNRIMSVAVDSARIVERTQPAKRMKEVRTLLQDTVATCLRERGYRQFRLTEAQQRQLGALRLGSAERHAYLHGLARDPAILEAQQP
jgi:hypothetical protein